VGVVHGLDHVGHQLLDFRGRGIGDFFGLLQQERMTHAGDF
jgi:hypothetical protein